MRYIRLMRKRLQLTDLDAEGAAVGMSDGLCIHVAGGAPGDEVEALIEHRSPHRPDAWARLEKLLQPSPLRVEPPCPAYGPCGGCRLSHLSYEGQLQWKTDFVRRTLGMEVPPCVPSPRPLGYRNREKRVFAILDGKKVLGAYAPRSHDVVDLAGCRVSEPPLDAVAQALAPQLPASRENAAVRYVIARVNHAGQVLLVLVTGGDACPEVSVGPEVVGVVQNLNPSTGNVLTGEENRTRWGQGFVDEQVGAVKLRLSPTAFFQVNREVAALIYAEARAAAQLDGTQSVIDAYCGVGGLALTLAPGAKDVLGIEAHAASIADARVSAELSGIAHARFEVADAAARPLHADVVVLNPPRKGCSPKLLGQLEARRVLYVSCNPETLARDLQILRQRGYSVERVQPYDMLPQTPHVEVLAVLTRP
jgi:23S rRNA (uracil1939-C5)-methyltransferase